jgi:hypothetical protein
MWLPFGYVTPSGDFPLLGKFYFSLKGILYWQVGSGGGVVLSRKQSRAGEG